MNSRIFTNTEGIIVNGFGGVSSSTDIYYALIFEFADE